VRNTPLFCLHGFGVRSWFFDPLKSHFAQERLVVAPDLYESTISGRVKQALAALDNLLRSGENPPVIVGHSLGGVIGSIIASKVKTITGLILLATPFDGRKGSKLLLNLQRFLIKRNLIPNRLAMSWFFSDLTPKKTQKAFFEKVVPEPSTLIDETFLPTLPHVEILPQIRIPTLCIGSRDDKIVNFHQMEKTTNLIPNATLWLMDDLNHSELIHGPSIVTKPLFDKIEAFLAK